MYPCGQTLPGSSTLNSFDGRVKAVGAIVPAGASGTVCAYATNDTELVLDINGYFVSSSDTSALAFYPMTPCRLVDTRDPAGPLGGPALVGSSARTFPLLASPCNVAGTAQAYSLNVAPGATTPRNGFLNPRPTGPTTPPASTPNPPPQAAAGHAPVL